MSGRQRLPAGAPRKASQRRARRAVSLPARTNRVWQAGDRVRWRDRDGVFGRDLGDGEHAEIQIVDRIYRVRTAELS
jgi:hypothetical protein